MKYIKMYADQAAYDADKGKKYPNVGYVEGSDTVIYMNEPDWSKQYLTFEALEDVQFKYFPGKVINYSLDGGSTWTSLARNTNTPTVSAGQMIMFKASLTPNSTAGIGRFISTGRFNAIGNPYSMLYGDNFIGVTSLSGKNYALKGFFSGCTGLVSADSLVLPATSLADSCYSGMFSDCIALTTPPKLPAATLTSQCYSFMFTNCSGMTAAPELPATTLTSGCYRSMFGGCKSLNYIKMLATDISATECLDYWVLNVASSGTFVKHPSMTSLTTGKHGIPTGWTVIDA